MSEISNNSSNRPITKTNNFIRRNKNRSRFSNHSDTRPKRKHSKKRNSHAKGKIRTNVNLARRKEFPDQIYHSASATNWGDRENYKFRDVASSKLRVIPIGGLESIGSNCTIIEYENDIIIIDIGLGFPGNDLIGVDALVPNLSYIQDKKDKIRGIIITHGHTDHIGAIHYVYSDIGSPTIYAPRMAAEMIREKFSECGLSESLKIQEIDGNSSYYLGKFHLSHFRMNHTIMDNYGVCIDTPIGRIVTPSDYKIDLTPYKEPPSDYSKLTKLGDEGVLLLMDESTNVKLKGWAPSESSIAVDLENTIRDANGRLIIGMFSTMIGRIRQIVEISARYGKKIAVFGKSLETNVKIAHRLGYIDVLNSVFISPDEVNKYSDDSIVILTTGSQGEPNAALMKMALGEHKSIKLKSRDTVVFSSSRIPGNEEKIDKLINLLAAQGCRILTNEHLTLHASGHGHKEDHKILLQMLKPKFIMPIHGEPSMLIANKENAMSLGYKDHQIIIAKNGAIVEIWEDGWDIVGEINSEARWVVGNRVGIFDKKVIKDRSTMSENGVIFVNIIRTQSPNNDHIKCQIITRGFLIDEKDNFFQDTLPQSVIQSIAEMTDRDDDSISYTTTTLVENEVYKTYGKVPLVVVNVIQ